MARGLKIKGWRKISENRYNIIWRNEFNVDHHLTINLAFDEFNSYLVWHNNKDIRKRTKTKSQAMKFAMNYMRKHPKG